MADRPSLVSRVMARFSAARRRLPILDHLIRTQEHYSQNQGSINAGGISYFGFLSFFPLMALALFVIGRVTEVYPEAQDTLTKAVTSAFPGVFGDSDGALSLHEVQRLTSALGWFGLLGALYTGLGWVSAMSTALLHVFEIDQKDQPNFVMGMLRDLVMLPILGVTLAVSVALSGVVTRFSRQLLGWVDLGEGLAPVLTVISVLVGVATSALLFIAMYTILGASENPRRALWQGALLAATGFEILKLLASRLLSSTAGQPAFQLFGIALIVVVWINYFARITLYGAAWAHTSPAARALREESAAPGA